MLTRLETLPYFALSTLQRVTLPPTAQGPGYREVRGQVGQIRSVTDLMSGNCYLLPCYTIYTTLHSLKPGYATGWETYQWNDH